MYVDCNLLHLGPLDFCLTLQLIIPQILRKRMAAVNRKTGHAGSKAILQPPKYRITMVDRFKCLNDNVDETSVWYVRIWTSCWVLTHLTHRLLLAFHHGHSMYFGHYTIVVCQGEQEINQKQRNRQEWHLACSGRIDSWHQMKRTQ